MRQHHWLERLVGEWTFQAETIPGDGEEAHRSIGTERVRMLGQLWAICEGEGTMPDGALGRNMMTLGYDPEKKKFVGTWIGSMMSNLWIYEGALNEEGTLLTLDSEGPDFETSGKTRKYRDVFELLEDGNRVTHSSIQLDNGTWQPFMTARYRREPA